MSEEQKKHPLVAWAEKQPKWQQHALKLLCTYGSADKIPDEEKVQLEKILYKETKGDKIEAGAEVEVKFTPVAHSDISSATGVHEGRQKPI